MESSIRYLRIRAVATAELAALALPAAWAEPVPTGVDHMDVPDDASDDGSTCHGGCPSHRPW